MFSLYPIDKSYARQYTVAKGYNSTFLQKGDVIMDIDRQHFLSKCFIFKSERTDSYVAGSTIGFLNPCFGYILSGRSKFVASDREFDLFPGDLVFIPKGQIYTSYWYPEPVLEFYSLNFEFVSEKATRYMYEFSKIHVPELLETFDSFYGNTMKKGNDYASLSEFYSILSYVDSKFQRATMPRESEIRPAVDYIEANCEKEISVPHLSKLCCMSESKFYSVFKSTVGYTPTDYKNLLKVRRAETLILQGKLTLEEICGICGFSSPSYLRRIYRKFTGKTPKESRRSEDII